MAKVWTASKIRKLAREIKDEEPKAPLRQFLTKLLKKEQAGFDSARSELWPRSSDPEKVVLVLTGRSVSEQGDEITLLCQTLGLRPQAKIFMNPKKKIVASNYIGAGLVEAAKNQLIEHGAGALVVDAPLSPSQMKKIEQALGVPVLDRQAVILSIFESHAQSGLAKLQVELAELQYLSSRLSHLWMGLSRQRGAKGGLGGRGIGEKRLELDRRTIKNRVSELKIKVKDAERVRREQAKRRALLPRVALVGYTNAGKSSLMSQLTRFKAMSQDKLFTTLDTTIRAMQPPTSPKILVSDTVGFVRDLPHALVASFKSTLLEAVESSLVLHVVDISHSEWEWHLETTRNVLAELGREAGDSLLVLNKIDLFKNKYSPFSQRQIIEKVKDQLGYRSMYWVSAKTGEGVDDLKSAIRDIFNAKAPAWGRSYEEET